MLLKNYTMLLWRLVLAPDSGGGIYNSAVDLIKNEATPLPVLWEAAGQCCLIPKIYNASVLACYKLILRQQKWKHSHRSPTTRNYAPAPAVQSAKDKFNMSIGHKFEGKQPGAETQLLYNCVACGNSLFSTAEEFEAGCGFPSFWNHIADHVRQQTLSTYGRTRTQLVCSQCGAHLGHLFHHSLTPTQVRYCISNSAIVKMSDG